MYNLVKAISFSCNSSARLLTSILGSFFPILVNLVYSVIFFYLIWQNKMVVVVVVLAQL